MKRAAFLVVIVLCFLWLPGCRTRTTETGLSVFRWDLAIEATDPVGEALHARLGVRVKALSAPWTGWSDKLNTMIASGSIPDIFIGYGIMSPDTYQRWIRDGVILAISDHVAGYPSLAEYASRWDEQKIGGKLYSLPVEAYVDHVLMVRDDWLREAGMDPPDTVDQLYAAAQAVRRRHGIFPVSSSAPHTAGFFWLNMLQYAYGSSWNDWDAEPGGGYVPSWISPGSREAVRFMSRLYAEQLLDPDFVTNSDDRKKEKFIRGQAAIVCHNLVDQYREGLAAESPGATLRVLPPVSGPGGRGMWGLNGYFSAVMLNAALDPAKRDAALRFLDFLYSPAGIDLMRYGVEGIHYKKEGGRRVPLLAAGADGDPVPLQEAAPSAMLKFLRALEWMWVPEWSSHYAEMQQTLEIGRTWSRAEKFPFVVTQARTELGQQLMDFAQQEWVALVTRPPAGADAFDAQWETFVRRYRELGGDRLIAEMNAAIRGRRGN